MSEASEAFVYWERVSDWFQRSAGLFESLSANCGLLESIVDGEPSVNLEGAKKLGEHTRRAESPCSRIRAPTRGVPVSWAPSSRP